jgi:hypothetical protein
MTTISTFLSGLLLSAARLLPSSVCAAGLQPFFTLKLASVNTLISVAENISTLAGFADNAEFRQVVDTVKSAKGVNLDEITGVAVIADSDGTLNALLLLPITDLWGAEIPDYPNIFDTIRPFLTKKGGGRFDITTPFGTYIAVQKDNYLVITPEGIADQVPADPKKLFADLEKYTLGIKLDTDRVEFETLEAQVFGPIIMLASMRNPEAGEQFENIVEVYRQIFKEFRTIIGGVAINPQTVDVEYSGTGIPHKDSGWGKMLAGMKQQPTRFSGFRGTPDNIILSGGSSITQDSAADMMPWMEPGLKQYETLLNAALEQIEAEDESGETSKFASKLFDSIRKIFELESKGSGSPSDSAFSLNTEGTLLFAGHTNALEEWRKLVSMVVGFAGKKVGAIAASLEIDINALFNREYITVEGFKISSFKVPMEKIASLTPNPDGAEALKSLAPGIFWAVNETAGKQAIAIAAGLDFVKTEQTFKSALEKTKTSVPVQRPMGIFSVQGLGKFLQQTGYPFASKAVKDKDELEAFKKVIDVLASVDGDAAITVDIDMKTDRMSAGYHISGKAIRAVISAVKAVKE